MLESVDKDCKAAFVFVDTKENTLIIKNKKSQKERKTFRKNQMEILELRKTKVNNIIGSALESFTQVLRGKYIISRIK